MPLQSLFLLLFITISSAAPAAELRVAGVLKNSGESGKEASRLTKYEGDADLTDFNLGGLAARDGRLYIGSRDEQAVLALDAETGQELDSIPLPAVRHLAAGEEVYAATDRGVVRLRDRKQIIEASKMDLTGIAVASHGEILVSDGTSHQIHRFTADGEAVATIGKPGGKKPIDFTSPWRGEKIDNVQRLPDAKIEVNTSCGGYEVKASVSLNDLGLEVATGQTYRADFGVTYGDAEGTDTNLRSYWSNQSTGLVDDIPGEIMLSPNLWGEVIFSSN